MSTFFYRGTRRSTGARSSLYDTDFPLALFKELDALHPLILGDWAVDKLDSKGRILETDIDWSSIPIEVTAGTLFGVPKPA